MRVIIYHQYFRTPSEGGGIRSYYLALGLLEAGHEVEIVTAHNSRKGLHDIKGIKVYYLPIFYDNSLGAFARIWAFVKFLLLAIWKGFALPKSDVNYVISTPLSIGIVALTLKLFRRIPYIFEIGDLWPEAPIQLGYIKNGMLKNFLYWFEKRVYRKAKRIVAMSPDIEAYVLRYEPKDKIEMIPNMADCEYYRQVDKPQEVIDKYAVQDKFVITYAGTAGRANHLEYLVEAAEICANKLLPLHFLVAAAGRELERLKDLTRSKSLHNITWVDYLDRDGVRDLLSISDAVYVSFANVPILSSGSPNKFFDGLAAGKLIITNFNGWTQKVIEENECGFVYNPNQPNEFVENLSLYLNNQAKLQSTQVNARKLAEQEFSRSVLIGEWLEVFIQH